MLKKKHISKRILIVAGLHRSLINFRGPLIKALCGAGLEVHAAAPELTSTPLIMEKLNEWGVICHDLHLQRTGLNPISDLLGLFKLLYLIKKIRPDTIMGYTIKPVIYGTLAAWLARVPNRFALITGLGYTFTGETRGKRKLIQVMAKKLYALALGKSKRVFFQNTDDEALFRKLNIIPKKIPSTIVNGSGIDLHQFPHTTVPEGKIVFLLIARLLGDKGVREYVAAAKIIRNELPETIFQIVGNIDANPDSISIEEIKVWQKEKVIEYLGRLEDVRPAIKNCSVYVLPSYREGTPRTVLEAMSMGRAIITTDAPGCRETVIDNENGFLVPVKSIQPLVAAMTKLIENPELIKKMGQRSREIAEEKYDVNKVNDSMLKAMDISETTNIHT